MAAGRPGIGQCGMAMAAQCRCEVVTAKRTLSSALAADIVWCCAAARTQRGLVVLRVRVWYEIHCAACVLWLVLTWLWMTVGGAPAGVVQPACGTPRCAGGAHATSDARGLRCLMCV